MIILPAIDVRRGRCVRLIQGDFERETVFGDDPIAMAVHWQAAGAGMLHVVDLDGAESGAPIQSDIIAEMIRSVDISVQVGGGIRSFRDAAQLIEAGAMRVIIGTAAVENPELIGQLVDAYGPQHIVVGVDARNGRVATQGWRETSNILATDLIENLADTGIRTVIYTDIDRDGTLTHPNFEATAAVAGLGVGIIASGGISAIEDLVQLSNVNGVIGAVVGRALYTGEIGFSEIDKMFNASRPKGRTA